MGYDVTVVDYVFPLLPLDFAEKLQENFPTLFEDWPVIDYNYVVNGYVQVELDVVDRNFGEWYAFLEMFTKKVAQEMKHEAYVLFAGEDCDIFGFGWDSKGRRIEPVIRWEVVEDEEA